VTRSHANRSANFKIRTGITVGAAKVTLRGKRMCTEFTGSPRDSRGIPVSADFRGLPGKSFDGRGNFNFREIKNRLFFPEIEVRQRSTPPAWHEHHHHNDRQDKRGGKALLAAFKVSVQET
jgi:ribosomal protein L5